MPRGDFLSSARNMSTPTETPDRYALKSTTTNASNNSPLDHPQTLQRSHVDYGDFGPLAHVNTAESRVPAFGGEFQPGLYRSPKNRKVANPAPLGLCAFALSIFLLGCIQMKVRGISKPNILVGPAFAYGGLVQLLSGMWEMAIGNTFGATVLSSYGGLWISIGIVYTPGGFNIMSSLEAADGGSPGMFYDCFGLMLFAWFIFTTLMLLCTLKSTVAFFSLFFIVDISLLLTGIGYLHRDQNGEPNSQLVQAGGFFAILTAFLAWYNAYAGVADSSNTWLIVPVVHFPWSEKGRHARRERREHDAAA